MITDRPPTYSIELSSPCSAPQPSIKGCYALSRDKVSIILASTNHETRMLARKAFFVRKALLFFRNPV